MKAEYSILIPTWNNLALLQNCIASIRKNSTRHFQILVYVNEGKDNTAAWLKEENIQHISSSVNDGICIAMNNLRKLAESPFLCYLNDDMYVLPRWDDHILNAIANIGHFKFFLSSTMIEPNAPGNACSINADFGRDLDAFDESGLLEKYADYEFADWSGSTWPPLWLSARLWDRIGGFSEEFSPGMYSDPDMAMKAWKQKVRIFRGISASRVYHFGSKSTRRTGMNEGRKLFLFKWGMTSRFFYKYYLRMGHAATESLPKAKPPFLGKLVNRWKVLTNS